MKILYYLDDFPKLSESFVINEMYELTGRGHEIAVFAKGSPDEPVEHDEVGEIDPPVYYAGVPTYDDLPDLVDGRVLNPKVLSRAVFPDDLRNHARYFYYSKHLSKFVEDLGGVDVIHSHFVKPDRIATSYVADRYRIPCTGTAHAYEIFANPNHRKIRRVCDRLDHVVSPSNYNKRYLIEEIGVHNDITVIPATTDVDKFRIKDRSEVWGRVLTVARLIEKKGYEYAIQAVARLLEDGYDVQYHIVGTGARAEHLWAKAEELGIERHVSFIGHVSDQRLREELREASLFVLPCVVASDGDRDVMPVALKEAMAAGVPCISTTVSAIPELITDGRDGLLVPPRDPEALAGAMRGLLDDPERRARLAEAGQRTIRESFDITRSVDRLESIFRSL